ncbi:GNAT family N-acetyltransferase [Candidatus Uhrbacteria bacterium]|nr:GNAT family N-acetyltransferase [Candidatus Uhrbacteria bacterium]
MTKNREVHYRNPEANLEQGEDPKHTFEIIDEKTGEPLARAEIEYFSKPIPYYQVSDLYTEHAYQGKGYASRIMKEIEDMLKKKNRTGFLVDAIFSDNPASGFYERRGWIPVPGNKDQYVFNLPKNVDATIFQSVEMRQTPLLERETFRKKYGIED